MPLQSIHGSYQFRRSSGEAFQLDPASIVHRTISGAPRWFGWNVENGFMVQKHLHDLPSGGGRSISSFSTRESSDYVFW